jgi:signal transduction histidine kinase
MVLRQLKQKEPHRQVIWKVEPGLAMFGDQSLIHIALENLLGNAWKYTLDRDPAEITVRRGEGEGIVIEIQDNGAGFDMAKADRLFLPFQRFHDDPRFPGHGIGLSIVKRVMLRHNGTISAFSAPGQGATFRLQFSTAPVAEEA